MESKRSTIIALAVIFLLIILIIILRVVIKPSETFYVLLGAGVAAIFAILIWLLVKHRSEKSFKRKLSNFGRELRVEYSFLRKVAGVPIKFKYKDLETATDNFQALIGRGSSASVFKGILDDGTPVAVKRIEGVEHGGSEFKAEVSAIASVQHVNLVRLLGYCRVAEGPNLLVYQFVHNGSLCNWIFPPRIGPNNLHSRSPPFSCLPWDLRYRVAVDVAKALSYLHHDCRSRILHLDVKPENILIDENFRAVVTDFGLSKMMGREVSRIYTSTMRGTEGYIAPEWILENGISEKSDIYSYGMVLLEIVGGRRNVRSVMENGERKWSVFPKIVAEKLKEGKLIDVVDKRLLEDGGDVDERRLRILVHVALWCIQENPKLRPNMARVVDMLEGRVNVDRPPESEMTLLGLLGIDGPDGNHAANRNSKFSFTSDVMSTVSPR
ncbi:non-specific serine/threonine protein kinase [Ranunculus cassubicifolius]